MISTARYASPLGELLLAQEDGCLIGLWLQEQKYFPENAVFWPEGGDLPIFNTAFHWLDDYFAGRTPDPHELALQPQGTAFRRKVWTLLCDIPYGSRVTYGQLARQLGKQRVAAQAVGGAVAHNPISIIIPCHRVVGANGSLTGYAGGLDKKEWLLAHESGESSFGSSML